MGNGDLGSQEHPCRAGEQLLHPANGGDSITRLTLEDIGEFTVSSDSLGRSLDSVNLAEEDILRLPNSAVVVDSGSGLEQGLARRLLLLRPDLKIIVIDPTLGLDPDRTDIAILRDGDKVNYFIRKSGAPPLDNKAIQEYQRYQRTRLSRIPNDITASTTIAPHLDIETNSVDLFIDSKGPSMYLDNEQLFHEYLLEIKRALKINSGEARIYPLGSWSGNPYSLDKELYFQKAMGKVIQHVSQIPSLVLVKPKCFQKQDGLGIVLQSQV